MDHNIGNNGMGNGLTLATIGLWMLGRMFTGMELGDITNFIAIASGSIAIFVNWPRFKARIIELRKKYFSKKKNT